MYTYILYVYIYVYVYVYVYVCGTLLWGSVPVPYQGPGYSYQPYIPYKAVRQPLIPREPNTLLIKDYRNIP